MNTMNSAEDLQPNIINDDLNIVEIPDSDTNANLSEVTSRGRIPLNLKRKPLQPPAKKSVALSLSSTSKKTIKLNNNVENMSTLNTSEDTSKMNGITTNGICSNHYLNDLIEPSCSGNDSYCKYERVVDKNLPVESNNDSDTASTVSIHSDMASTVSIDSDGDSESVSEDGCIYTYKGDNVADLPSSFFYIPPNVPENQEPVVVEDAPAPNRQDASSPEMDYLEMDFDPSNNGDADSASEIEYEVNLEDEETSPRRDERDEQEPSEDVHENLENGPSTSVNCNRTSATVPIVEEPIPINNVERWVEDNASAIPPETVPDEEKVMPWSCTLEQRTKAFDFPHSKLVHCNRGDVISPSENVPYMNIVRSLSSEGLDESIEPAMIWTREEALLNQVTQIGPSSCGATAVWNVLNALRFPVTSVDKLRECVTTRLRKRSSPLTKYLISRSRAGSTHKDIIDGLHKLSNGTIYARFFHMYPERVVNMYTWLAFWIKNGAVPIATLNLQRCLGTIPDAWHHQMIYGVDSEGIHLTNPIECVDASLLWSQLCSESELLVRRFDVLSRWNISTDLPDLMRIHDVRWQRMNVVGQVANLVHENNRELRPGCTNTPYIRIPAAYSSGITLATTVNSPAFTLLKQSPELPLLVPVSHVVSATSNN